MDNKSHGDKWVFFVCERQVLWFSQSCEIFFAQNNLTLILFWFMLTDPLDYVYEKESTISRDKQGLTMEVKWKSTNRFIYSFIHSYIYSALNQKYNCTYRNWLKHKIAHIKNIKSKIHARWVAPVLTTTCEKMLKNRRVPRIAQKASIKEAYFHWGP